MATTVSSPKKSASSKPTKAERVKSALDEPLVTVRNPFRYFYYWLDDIKNWIKKDSNGEIRLHIPFKWFVTALIIFLAGGAVPAYWQGKAVEYASWIIKPTPTPIVIIQPTPTPAPILVTRLGIIKATYQVRNLLPTPTPSQVASPSAQMGIDYAKLGVDGPFDPTPEPVRYVLMTDTYKLIFLKTPNDIPLQKYIGYKALITGYYSSITNTLTIDDLADMEILY